MIKKLILISIFVTGGFLIANHVSATNYYIDFSITTSGGGGTATTSAFANLQQFTQVARAPGDIAFVRRGFASTTNVSDLNFTSDGKIGDPITLRADYSNLWGNNHSFEYAKYSSSSQTYTVANGSSTMTASAAQSDIRVGMWVYIQGDTAEEFSYEVSAVASTSITFYLPYKGLQAGSGKTLNLMPSNPQWNVASWDFQWNFDTDNGWKVQGIDIRGTDLNGQVEIDSSIEHQFIDCIFVGDGTTAYAINFTDDSFFVVFKKNRVITDSVGIFNTVDTYGYLSVENSLMSTTNYPIELSIVGYLNYKFIESKLSGTNYGFFNNTNNGASNYIISARNIIISGATAKISSGYNTTPMKYINIEDYQGIIGANQQNLGLTTVAEDTPQLLSTSTIVRSGGGATSLEVRPTTNLNATSSWDFSRLQLFEYPIYANTTNKTYSMYFMSSSTSAWITDPNNTVNPQLWIECEYWNFPSGGTASRSIKKSTATVDFNGSTAWQSISVNCQPTTTGILYLRGFYAKRQEFGKMNQFFMDTTPVITTP